MHLLMVRFGLWLARRLARVGGRSGRWLRGREPHGRALTWWERCQFDARRWATFPGGAEFTGNWEVDSARRGEPAGGGVAYLLGQF